jgi:hypothetical protein
LAEANATASQIALYEPERSIAFPDFIEILKHRFELKLGPKDWLPH